jgi:nicotinate-nucleotide pyrophosphorylase (carboxylating)
MTPIDLKPLEGCFLAAIEEDLGAGDITSQAVVGEGAQAFAEFVAKEPVRVCGLSVAEEIVKICDAEVRFQSISVDGAQVDKGAVLASMAGRARSILAAERTSLNFLQRLSGIATRTEEYVSALAGTRAQILDTRKTVPGLRLLDKYAVACGGGVNHRVGLFDAVLIKNNHLIFQPSVTEAVRAARERVKYSMKIEVEVQDLTELQEAIEGTPDMILLDNFTAEQTQNAVKMVAGRIPLESSGGITLSNIRGFAEAGVDFISVGALTHSVIAADIHLRVNPE